jgi:glycosyltransferase involved in cell wall biosynthesis
MAITEALACGVPVVITDACHFPEVGQADAGVIVPLDAEAVAEGLRRVLDDKALAGKMGERGRQMVMDRFTWPAIAEMTLRNYALRA